MWRWIRGWDADAQVENCYFPMQRAQIRKGRKGQLGSWEAEAPPKHIQHVMVQLDIWLQEASRGTVEPESKERIRASCHPTSVAPTVAPHTVGPWQVHSEVLHGERERPLGRLRPWACHGHQVWQWGTRSPMVTWGLVQWFKYLHMKTHTHTCSNMFNGSISESIWSTCRQSQSHTRTHMYPLVICYIAIENGWKWWFIDIYRGFSQGKWWFSIAMLVDSLATNRCKAGIVVESHRTLTSQLPSGREAQGTADGFYAILTIYIYIIIL